MAFPFYDRVAETQWLKDAFAEVQTDCSRMLVLTGRRRIGKTALVDHAFEGGSAPYLYMFVNKGQTPQENLDTFWTDNAEALGQKDMPVRFPSYEALFRYLLERSEKEPLILMMDEFQNFETVDAGFFGTLQMLWDKYRKSSKMLLILTGSVATAMREITENVNAPLYGRHNGQLMLRPFTTGVLKTILTDHNPHWEAEDLLTLWMLTGGVAKYAESLMESGKTTEESMLRYALSADSFFMAEGETWLKTEFKSDYAVYYSILSKIAAGKTKRSEILSSFGEIDVSSQFRKLTDYFRLVEKECPVGGAQTNRSCRYVLADAFLQFWFLCINPYSTMIERGRNERLFEHIRSILPDYMGRHILESWFKQELWETGNYSEIGPWWDRKGENEIDIVAVNPFDKELLFIEVKRNPERYDEGRLKEKAYMFLAQQSKYRDYALRFECRSLNDIHR